MNILERICANLAVKGTVMALTYNGKTTTYSQLAERVGLLATAIKNAGAVNECIAIETGNIAEHVIGILAVLVSGNYYISITEENRHYVRESLLLSIRYSVLLSTEQNKIELPGIKRIHPDLLSGSGEVNYSNLFFKEENNFCVFITSGSTGIPKIVVHTLCTVSEDVNRQIVDNSITENDRADFLGSLSFSVSLSCIFPVLAAGGTLAVYPLKENGIEQLFNFWKEQRITYTTMGVSAFNAVCKLHQVQLPPFRCIAIGTEPVTPATISLFQKNAAPGTVLKIAYASTETRTIAQIILRNDASLNSFNGSVGRPVNGKTVKIISDTEQELQRGETGEIVVISEFIAKEYFGHVAPTSFQYQDKTISYRTGDIGYINDEGELFITGRKISDNKIYGIRIDLALIEKELNTMDELTQVAVVINSARGERKAIVAFVQAKTNKLDIRKVHDQFAATLPPGHFPHFFCLLDTLPLTHTGKFDRKALERTVFTPIETVDEKGTIKANELEYIIIKIFNETLHTTAAGPNSSFVTDLGGDSLLSLVAIADLEKRINIPLPAYCIWAYPTPVALAAFIESGQHHKKIHAKAINAASPDKRNLYFLNRFRGGNDYAPIVNSELARRFNLIHLLYELEKIEDIATADEVITEMGSLLALQNNGKKAIVLGLSFHGFVAQQLTVFFPEIGDCIMLDTYNYFELDTYSQKEVSKAKKLAANVKNTVIGSDHRILIDFIKGRFKKKGIQKIDHSPFRRNTKHLFWHDYYKKAVANNKTVISENCLFFRATRTFAWHPTHGYNWRKYVNGKFKVVNVKCTHLEITAREHSHLIVNKILEHIPF